MSSFCKCKSYSHFFSKNISVYATFNDQSFNDTLTNEIVSFEQLGHMKKNTTFMIIFILLFLGEKKLNTKQTYLQ